MKSLILYITIFIIITILSYKIEKEYKKEKIKKEVILMLILLILIILTAFATIRHNVGTDYATYIKMYNTYKTLDFSEMLNANVEITFILISKIAYFLKNERIIFAIYCLVTVGFILASILKRKDKISISLSMFLYLFLVFSNSFNGMRQYAAISIIAFSYTFINEEKFLKFLLCVILASLFHNTAILFLPFYFLGREPKKDISKKQKLLFLCLRTAVVIGLIFIIININRFIKLFSSFGIGSFERFNAYIDAKNGGRNLMLVVSLAIIVFLNLYRKRLAKYDKDNNMLFFFLIIEFVLLLTGYIAPAIKRISLYFQISQIYLLPAIPKIVEDKKEKQILTLVIMIYAVSIFVISVYVLKQSNLIPYQTIFGGI